MTTDTAVRDIAVAIPASVRVFEKYQIDFCCNGKRPLEAACSEAGISAEAVLAEIRAACRTEPVPERDWISEPLAVLVSYIVSRHHEYLERELPQIEARLEKVVANHSADMPWLSDVRETFLALRDELRDHLRKEEIILFPYIETLESGEPGYACFPTVAAPIRVMLSEHDNASAALAEMRRMTGGYTAPENGCPGFRAFMADLAALEADLHQHIHLENNILFPRALERETGSHAGTF